MSPYKDVNMQRAANRESMRKRRSGGVNKSSVTSTTPLPDLRIVDAESLMDILSEQLTRLMGVDGMDEAVRSRAVAALISVGVRLCEAVNTLSRLEALENKLSEGVVREVSDP